MSTMVSSPSNDTDPEGRLKRVQALRDNQLFQSLFYGKIVDMQDKAEVAATDEATPPESRQKILHELWLLRKITDILDSEERAAKAAIPPKPQQRKQDGQHS